MKINKIRFEIKKMESKPDDWILEVIINGAIQEFWESEHHTMQECLDAVPILVKRFEDMPEPKA